MKLTIARAPPDEALHLSGRSLRGTLNPPGTASLGPQIPDMSRLLRPTTAKAGPPARQGGKLISDAGRGNQAVTWRPWWRRSKLFRAVARFVNKLAQASKRKTQPSLKWGCERVILSLTNK
jgi:hypothetical protein